MAKLVFMGVRGSADPTKMAWLMPRVARAVPYLGFILVSGTRPAPTGDA